MEHGEPRYFTGKACRNGHTAERRTADGKCMECQRVRDRRRNSLPHRRSSAHKSYRKNRAFRLKQAAIWQKQNPERVAAATAAYKARKIAQTPNDADRAKIASFYDMANRITRITGTPYHVDHIEALANGGLHHHDNLVVMRGDLNQSKGATDWPWLKWFNEGI